MWFLLAAAVSTAAVPARGEVAPQQQARATVRIIAGEALRFAQIEKSAPGRLRGSRIRSSDGTAQTARLVEFE